MGPVQTLELQQINKFFYNVAISRVQPRFEIRSQKILLTRFGLSKLNEKIIQVDLGAEKTAYKLL